MNPVLTVIDAGHYQRSQVVKGAQSILACRSCGETWPCSTITSARRKHALSVRAG